MWRKLSKILLFVLAVTGIIVYICYASSLAQEYRARTRVCNIEISLPDNSENRNFTSLEQVREKLDQSGMNIYNELIDSIDVVNIAAYIARDGYVSDVDVHVAYSGTLYVDIKQYTPALRLLSGGLNSYVTEEGQVFCQPYESAYYTLVVTGKYKPYFGTYYEGNAKEYFANLIGEENNKLTKISTELASLRVSRRESNDVRELVKIDSMEVLLKKQKAKSENRKKKLQKRSVDFANLINFVSKVNKDPFWSAEVVQLVADTTYMGEIALRLIPRSGNFEIDFGTLDNSDEKLAKLRKFYEKGLPYVGWELYKVVDVRYDKQIICRE